MDLAARSAGYWAFISYCSQDVATARWLQRFLESYAIPRHLVGHTTPAGPAPVRFRPVFRDRTELAADPDLLRSIDSALEKSGYLIVVCSPDSAKSHWVGQEISYFQNLHGRSRVLAIIARGTLTGDYQDCFPPALLDAQAGGSLARQPIAADLRPGADGRRTAALKLVAGMLGVGLDELVRRDRQRRHRRLVIMAAASFAGMLLMAGLALQALLARNDARAQRGHAESLIEFMLTDLRKKLEPTGQLAVMDGVGREALHYYGSQRPASLDDESLSRQARALRLMGEISVKQGDLREALISFQKASASTEEILARSPSDGQKIFNHAQNVFWVGEMAHQRGDLASARVSFDIYLGLAEKLSILDPNNGSWRAEIAYAEGALGTLYLEQGDAPKAVRAFEKALDVDVNLVAARPDDLSALYALGQGHAWLADALRKEGRLAATSAHRRVELGIYDKILQTDPTIRDAKFSSVVALESLGDLAMITGDTHAALQDYGDAASRAEALLLNERDNMDLSASVAIAEVDLGEASLAIKQIRSAEKAQRRAHELLDVALHRDNSVTLWHEYSVETEQLQAAIAYSERAYDVALRLDERVLEGLDKQAPSPVNTQPFWLVLRSRLQTGDDLAAMGRMDEARRQWDAIANGLAGPLEGFEPKLLVILRDVKLRLADPAGSAVASKQLNAMFEAPNSSTSAHQRPMDTR